MRKFLITLIASISIPATAFADTYVKPLSSGYGFFFLPGSWLPSGGWVKVDIEENSVLFTHYYDVRNKLTGRRTRYMHEVTATRACPLTTFDECILGDNQINLPQGSNAKEYSYEIKWTEGGENYTQKLDLKDLEPIDKENKKKFIDDVKTKKG